MSPRKTFPSVYHLSDSQEEFLASQQEPALQVLFIFSLRLGSISHSKSCLTHGHYSCLVCRVAGGQVEEYLLGPAWIYLQYQTLPLQSFLPLFWSKQYGYWISFSWLQNNKIWIVFYTSSEVFYYVLQLWCGLQTNNSKDLLVKHKQVDKSVNQRPFNPLSSKSMNNSLSVSCLLPKNNFSFIIRYERTVVSAK